ncbi:hypothetical protein [Streptomyces sp. NBC_00557]|uniref:hypothetical protein n=1 Tax=Streptomyces sp. NBC_00557 TaxID=2975776 RepID=UPI002E80D9BA|nr:hypothetical protein [Streptomyces sp. NBC_00557]WUC38678.1 hypothetical protein OG956_32835 [Streptomyces sp. NBC_00557]
MHTSHHLLRSGPALAAAVVLPVALAGPSAAAPGISVSTTGSTVSVVTSACSETNGNWGTAALLTGKQSTLAEGRQAALAGTAERQSAAWKGVRPGTYTVLVVCSDGSAAGSQAVTVSSRPAPKTASSASPAPARGVLSGLAGAARDHGPLTLGVGAAVVGTGIVATAWYLRRRAKPYRL